MEHNYGQLQPGLYNPQPYPMLPAPYTGPPQFDGLPPPTYGGPAMPGPGMPQPGGPFIVPSVQSSSWKIKLVFVFILVGVILALYYTGKLEIWWNRLTNPRWAMNITTCNTADAATYLSTAQSSSQPPQNLNILCDMKDIADYTYRSAGPNPSVTSGCYGQQLDTLFRWGQNNPAAVPMPEIKPCTGADYKVYLTNLAYWQKMQGAPLNNTAKYTSIYVNPDGTIATAAQIAINAAQYELETQQSSSSTATLSGVVR